MIRRQDAWPLGALGFLLLATAAWWALALWPAPSGAPEWLERTRAVCFNATASGLPDSSGWILLIGQPIGMVVVFLVGWRAQAADTLAHLRSSGRGRGLIAGAALLVVAGLTGAGVRVATAGVPDPVLPGSADVPASYARVDRPMPEMAALVDQRGQAFGLRRLQGRAAFVTFAFGHCATVCPMVVHSSRMTRDALKGERDFTVVVVTLDPWRDTPSRLPRLVEQYGLDPRRDFVLSGAVGEVEVALDAWRVGRVRDGVTGDITHPALVYLVEPDGTVAYASTGAAGQLQELARRLR
jgi:cytochrome oxidase Cu insertion factor (SCO1/SenC/PrrC family)